MPGTSSVLRLRSMSVDPPETVVTLSSVSSAVTDSTRCQPPRTCVRPTLNVPPLVSTSAVLFGEAAQFERELFERRIRPGNDVGDADGALDIRRAYLRAHAMPGPIEAPVLPAERAANAGIRPIAGGDRIEVPAIGLRRDADGAILVWRSLSSGRTSTSEKYCESSSANCVRRSASALYQSPSRTGGSAGPELHVVNSAR